jgi:hypothetical protein
VTCGKKKNSPWSNVFVAPDWVVEKEKFGSRHYLRETTRKIGFSPYPLVPKSPCPLPSLPNFFCQIVVDKISKKHLYLSLDFKDNAARRALLLKPLNLTVSLRGAREVRDNYQLFRLTVC